MAQQTAVDIMFEKAISVLPLEFFYSKGILKETYLQAKEIEKQQHGNTWDDSRVNTCIPFEQYYIETYTK
jgi:hypothetical protein